MTATEQNLEMNYGESKKIVVDETVDDDGEIVPLDAAQKLEWVAKDFRGGSEFASKEESSSPDVNFTDASVGAYEILVDSDELLSSETKVEEEVYHRVRVTDADGEPSDLLEGTITIKPS